MAGAGPTGRRCAAAPAAGAVERLEVQRGQEAEHREEAGDDPRPEDVDRRRLVDEVVQRAELRELALRLRDRRDPEERVEDHDHTHDQEQRLDDTEDAADQLVGERCLLEDRLLVVEALDHEREGDRGGDEHDQEAQHHRVLVRKLVPVGRQIAAERIAEVRGDEEREEHRREAEQPPDRALDEPEHEHREAQEEDEQVEWVDGPQETQDVHERSLSRDPLVLSRARGGLRVAGGSGRVPRTQVLIRPPTAPTDRVIAATVASTSESVSVRSGDWKTIRQARLFSAAASGAPR